MKASDLRQRTGLILDANLLLLYCVGRYDPLLIGRFTERLSRYTVEDFRLLLRFMAQFRAIIITPNVLTEVVNLIDKRNGRYDGLLGMIANDITRLAEHYAPSRLVANTEPRHFRTFGLTDMLLAQLARTDYVVLTDDTPLWSFMVGQGCVVYNFIG